MQKTIPVWDIWVRLGHWLIVLGILFQQISGGDADYIDAHATVGILLGGWVLFRILWGFIGPKYARFSSFPPPNPIRATESLKRVLMRQPEKVPGHSAIGGLAVGETQREMFEVLDGIKDNLPIDRPRYLMGVGTPSDILGAVKRGIDMFDCVLPTRSGRTGLAFTWNGRIQIRNSEN